MDSKSTETARPRGDRRSVMVVTREYHDPAHKPPPLFCLMLACRKGGAYLRDTTVLTVLLLHTLSVLCTPVDSAYPDTGTN